jgi:hypothetical protein
VRIATGVYWVSVNIEKQMCLERSSLLFISTWIVFVAKMINIGLVIEQARSNWDQGKALEAIKKKELLLKGNFKEAAGLNIEWRTVSWYPCKELRSVETGTRSGEYDMPRPILSKAETTALINAGFNIIADYPDCINILMTWIKPGRP